VAVLASLEWFERINMGMLHDHAIQGSLVAVDAYHRINDNLRVGRSGADFSLAIFTDRSEYLAGLNPVKIIPYRYDDFDKADNTRSAHKQCYEWLKTLDDFAGATDVLEQEE
jgi:hypothetical protein